MGKEEIKLFFILFELESMVDDFCKRYTCMLSREEMLEIIARNAEVRRIINETD